MRSAISRGQGIQHRGRGFTLLEVLTIVLIIGVLLGIVMPLYLRIQRHAEIRTVERIAAQVKTQMGDYTTRFGALPITIMPEGFPFWVKMPGSGLWHVARWNGVAVAGGKITGQIVKWHDGTLLSTFSAPQTPAGAPAIYFNTLGVAENDLWAVIRAVHPPGEGVPMQNNRAGGKTMFGAITEPDASTLRPVDTLWDQSTRTFSFVEAGTLSVVPTPPSGAVRPLAGRPAVVVIPSPNGERFGLFVLGAVSRRDYVVLDGMIDRDNGDLRRDALDTRSYTEDNGRVAVTDFADSILVEDFRGNCMASLRMDRTTGEWTGYVVVSLGSAF